MQVNVGKNNLFPNTRMLRSRMCVTYVQRKKQNRGKKEKNDYAFMRVASACTVTNGEQRNSERRLSDYRYGRG